MPFEVLAAGCGRITKEASPITIVRLKINCVDHPELSEPILQINFESACLPSNGLR
jgi:hypothetical protein